MNLPAPGLQPAWRARWAMAALTLAWALPAHADFQDEIQVDDDAINAPGEYGLELHANTTPSGRATPGYRGEVPPRHALRVTPEFSYNLSDGLGGEWAGRRR